MGGVGGMKGGKELGRYYCRFLGRTMRVAQNSLWCSSACSTLHTSPQTDLVRPPESLLELQESGAPKIY